MVSRGASDLILSNNKMTIVKGSLHSHGCWTDYRNPNERKNFPFDLETFVNLCIDCKRDFQAITDIMANFPEKPEFIEDRYKELLATANPKATYELQHGKRESILYFPTTEKTFIIPRTQEVLTNKHFKHILAVGTESNIKGGQSSLDTLKEIQDKGGYSIVNHPFMCNAWTEQEILDFYHNGLIAAIEWNGGLTFPSFLSYITTKIPSKKSNIIAEYMEKNLNIPCIANDDSHSKSDIKKGAHTVYIDVDIQNSRSLLVDKIGKAIKRNSFARIEKYSSFFSPFMHQFIYGTQSRKKFVEDGLPL